MWHHRCKQHRDVLRNSSEYRKCTFSESCCWPVKSDCSCTTINKHEYLKISTELATCWFHEVLSITERLFKENADIFHQNFNGIISWKTSPTPRNSSAVNWSINQLSVDLKVWIFVEKPFLPELLSIPLENISLFQDLNCISHTIKRSAKLEFKTFHGKADLNNFRWLLRQSLLIKNRSQSGFLE